MTLPPELLAPILAAPHDDLPRLVAADWLEEHDEPGLAEFIRLQIEQSDKWPHFSRDNCMGDASVGQMCPYDDGGGLALCPACDDLREESGLPASVFGEGKVFFRRGFVGEIRCTQAQWVGERCGHCEGRGEICEMCEGEYAHVGCLKCNNCHGTGRNPGIAGRVMAAWPVTTVVLTDRKPYEDESSFRSGWFKQVKGGATDSHTIDASIWELIEGYIRYGNGSPSNVKWFNTLEDAYSAQSSAAIAFGRRTMERG